MKRPRKYRITIEDESHLETVARARLRPATIFLLIVTVFLFSIFLSGLIIYLTPLRTLLPGYLKESERSATEESILRLDSLQQAYATNQAFIDNFLRVTDVSRTPNDSSAMAMARSSESGELSEASQREREFVSTMEERERFNISVLAPLAAEGLLFSPVSSDGVFTSDSRTEEEGVVILPQEEGIQAAADGSVIAVYYSLADRGYVSVLQHARGFITAYSHVGTPLAGVGDIVYAGQIIAMAPPPDAKGIRKFSVRIWHNGLPIIPYQYVGNPLSQETMIKESYEAPRGK